MNRSVQSAFEQPRVLNGNAILQAFRQQQRQLPPHYGYIRNIDTGETVEKIGDKPIVESKATLKKEKRSPRDVISSLVKQYNDLLIQNDVKDDPIRFEDYDNNDSAYYLDWNDNTQVDSEKEYLQNQIWKLQGDKRYVPDYEDVMSMPDDKFEAYTKQLFSNGR